MSLQASKASKHVYGSVVGNELSRNNNDDAPFVSEIYCDDVENGSSKLPRGDDEFPEGFEMEIKTNPAGAYLMTMFLLIILCIPSFPVNVYGFYNALRLKLALNKGDITGSIPFWQRTRRCMLVGLLFGLVVYLGFGVYVTLSGKYVSPSIAYLSYEPPRVATTTTPAPTS